MVVTLYLIPAVFILVRGYYLYRSGVKSLRIGRLRRIQSRILSLLILLYMKILWQVN